GIRDFHVTGVQTCALPISPIDHGVDRPEVYSSNAQPTGTNRPRACHTSTQQNQQTPIAYSLPASTNMMTTKTWLPRSKHVSVSRSEERRVGKRCRMRRAPY